MISLLNAVPFYLLGFSLISDRAIHGVEGIAGGTPAADAGFVPRPDKQCYQMDFFQSRTAQCMRENGLPAYSQLLQIHNLADPHEIICRDQQALTRAYRCIYRFLSTCVKQYRVDFATSPFFRDMEHHLPDPDLFVEAVHHVCQMDDLGADNWPCRMDGTRFVVCFLQEILSFVSEALKMIDDGRFESGFKDSFCKFFEGFQSCLDAMTRCKQSTVGHMKAALSYLIPPTCSHANADKGKGMSSHDEM